jgi:hypothetical protein
MIARRRSPTRGKPAASVTGRDRTAVRLEEMHGHNQVVIEAVVAVGERLDRHVAETAQAIAAVGERLDRHAAETAQAFVAVGARG